MTAFCADVAVAGAAIRYASANDATAYADATDYATDAAAAAAEALAYPDAAATAVAAAADTNANTPAIWHAVRADAEQAATRTLPGATLPLWPGGPGPLAERWEEVKARVGETPDAADWQFWIDWYDGLLDGRPMLGDAARTGEMLEKIALIDPETWDKGPEVVNPVIREIWELHRLRAEVAALQAEKQAMLAGRATAAQRAHNQPPDLVETAPEVARGVTIIWAGLDEACEELEKEPPDKARLAAIAGRMLAALQAVAAYCGKVANRVVMSAATAGGVALMDHVVNNGRLWQFVRDLATFAAGG